MYRSFNYRLMHNGLMLKHPKRRSQAIGCREKSSHQAAKKPNPGEYARNGVDRCSLRALGHRESGRESIIYIWGLEFWNETAANRRLPIVRVDKHSGGEGAGNWGPGTIGVGEHCLRLRGGT